jgi:hypothetical protein
VAARNRLALAAFGLLLLSGCCSGKYCEIEGALEQFTQEARFAKFQALSAEDQVGLYIWQLKRSHPPHSEYGEMIVRNQAVTSTALLENISDEASPIIVHIGLLAIDRMDADVVRSLSGEQLSISLERCRHAFDSETTAEPICSFPRIESVLQQKK